MSVIQNIRDKYARLMVVLIAVSLLGFILMDAFSSRSNLFSGNTTTVGKINGKKVELTEFEAKLKNMEDMQKAQGYNVGDAGRQGLIEQTWNQEIAENLLADQYEKLGITVTTKEMNDYLFGANPPADLRQRFTDSTGQYNGALAVQAVNQIKKQGKPEDKEQLANYFESLRKQRASEKYSALLSNTIYMPKWLVEKQTADNALVARASYVAIPYTTVSDSAVKVTDAEIDQYIKKHRTEYEQKEETRSISYVLFPTLPTAADTAATRSELEKLRAGFDTTTNYAQFTAVNSSTMPYYDGLVSKKQMQQPNKDSILAAGVGVTYGPYLDRNQQNNQSYLVLSRIVEAKNIADTVKVRHILLSVARVDPQSGQQVPGREDAAAKTLADSILNAINSGARFDSLVTKYSDDPGSKDKGGVYDSIGFGRMVPQFNDFIFTHSPGQRGVVKTDFGYHIIEVLGARGSDMAYKIAYMARPIVTGDQTENDANTAASQFAADSRSLESFNQNYDKNLRAKGINKQTADLRELDFNIPGAGTSRPLVKEVFTASKGEVLPVQRLTSGGYIVAVVTAINPAGVQSVAQARAALEPVLRNKKKAEQIKKNIGTISTLEAVASKVNQPIATADSLHFNGNNNVLGFEYKVIGASFNPANKGKVVNEAIEGQGAVYVLRVDNVSAAAAEAAGIEQQRALLMQDARQRAGQASPIEALKKAASIKDYRAKFY
ncbi:peptidylprolyl isomerase [Flaviaesturariibacter aridisoli]|uniref:Periplasmic chaperone PpiD n=1 Tax=Flaviaesturariibacter aridisoli TaxID=2545761 RepID=A0A4V2WMK9_9BACT|nr:peptidylprolyl isomerase [Flaviaesturariibacter aridisoli]TCZ70484.1 peptidylprolyl isomerase [Flaviaesturariibacter aridisoli]